MAIGPEVAFVDVGGKGEATIEVSELKDADGALEVAVGDRIQAMVVSTAGGLTLSRQLARGAATDAAARRRLPHRPAGRRQGRAGDQRRLRSPHRPPARLLPDVADRHRPDRTRRRTKGRSTPSGSSSSRKAARTSSCRGGRCSRRSSAPRRRGPPRRSSPGAVITGRVTRSASSAPSSIWAAACRACCTSPRWAGRACRTPSQVVKPGEEITVKVLRVDDDRQKISLGLKQLTADPWSTVEPPTRSARCAPAGSPASPSSAPSSSSSRASRRWRTRRRSRRPADADGWSVGRCRTRRRRSRS